jgi:hypothetical protein
MKTVTAPVLLAALLLASIAPATATTLDVTNNSQVTLGTNASLLFYISSSALSSAPGEIEILLGGMPLGGPVASIPGTSGVYLPGILFSGTLESLNGSISIPFIDSDARRLDLPPGDMLLTPGSRSGGSYSGPIDLLSAEATINSTEAALLASGEVVIDLTNAGAPITFGYSGSSIATAFSASVFTGSESMGAQVDRVECSNAPEPGTIGLLIIGLTLICTRVGLARARQYQLEKVRIAAPRVMTPNATLNSCSAEEDELRSDIGQHGHLRRRDIVVVI